MDDRIKYTIATLDAIELEKSKKMPKIESRLESTETKLQKVYNYIQKRGTSPDVERSNAIDTEKFQELSRNIEAKTEKITVMRKEIKELQKKNNLPLLEHKLCERMDDLIKAMCRTLADKFETSKRFRIAEL